MVRGYLDDVSERVGTSVHLWGLDEADLAAMRADPIERARTAAAVLDVASEAAARGHHRGGAGRRGRVVAVSPGHPPIPGGEAARVRSPGWPARSTRCAARSSRSPGSASGSTTWPDSWPS